MITGKLHFASTGEVYVEVSADTQAQWNMSGIALLSSDESVRKYNKNTRPKKPPNAFFLYKASKRHEFPERNQRNYNKTIAEMWMNESDEVKNEFQQRAKEGAREAKAKLEADKFVADRLEAEQLAAEARPKL